MADFIFDGPNRLIIEPTGTGNTTADVARDLYSAWIRWVISGQGAGYINAFDVEGGTPIGSTGSFTGATLLLTNGWKVRGASYDHQLILNGNLFSDDGIVSSPNPDANVEILVNASVNAQGVASGSGVTPQDVTDIVNAVFARLGENGETFDQTMRLIRADAAGSVVVDENGNYAIKSADGQIDRITGTSAANGGRTVSATDAS